MNQVLSSHLAELCKEFPGTSEEIIKLAYREGMTRSADLVIDLQVREAIMRRGLARVFSATLNHDALQALDDIQMVVTDSLVNAGYNAPTVNTQSIHGLVDGVMA